MKNYYEILEVNNKASREVIERAYRVLIKKYHPDIFDGEERIYAEKKVRDLNEAYKILSDDFHIQQNYQQSYHHQDKQQIQYKYQH